MNILKKSIRIRQLILNHYSTLIKNGPNLKDFLNKKVLINEETNDEIITNKLLYNTHEQILENEIEPMIKRKIYFEVHGCQMNTNDTEVALAILNKTGLYEKINNEKEADIVLISIYLCLVKFKFGF